MKPDPDNYRYEAPPELERLSEEVRALVVPGLSCLAGVARRIREGVRLELRRLEREREEVLIEGQAAATCLLIAAGHAPAERPKSYFEQLTWESRDEDD
ncbi:hypothetical protein [uncultured Abyssibacter sp.]|mgnify:CR=1 FL=1|uniref:hypothetical protein n=1 Tax=uncultured Abyssibacter sp. TaxID=2320202 RepID=UPI0032B18262